MIRKGHISVLALAFCLAASFIVASVGYDPWVDLDDDGDIDPDDFAIFAGQYGTSGEPINKTALLLELEAGLDSLNLTLLTEYYNITECDVIFVDALGDIITGYLNVDSGTLYVNDANNRVGIGTTNPTTKLDVVGDIQGFALKGNEIRLGSTEGNHVIYFYEDGAPTNEYIYWKDAQDWFYVSDDIYIFGTINIPMTTRYYYIPGCAWQPYNSTYDFYSGVDTYTRTAGPTSWYAPVNLPHGAQVVEFRAWIWDNDTGYDVDVELWRETAGSTTNQMASISSSGNSSTYKWYWAGINPNYAIIDNEDYAYFVYGRLRSGDSNHRLAQVRIAYSITETLP